jgi:hypothetical protein
MVSQDQEIQINHVPFMPHFVSLHILSQLQNGESFTSMSSIIMKSCHGQRMDVIRSAIQIIKSQEVVLRKNKNTSEIGRERYEQFMAAEFQFPRLSEPKKGTKLPTSNNNNNHYNVVSHQHHEQDENEH